MVKSSTMNIDGFGSLSLKCSRATVNETLRVVDTFDGAILYTLVL